MDPITRPLYMLSTRDTPQTRDTYRLRVKKWNKIFHSNRDKKKARVVILVSDKIESKGCERKQEGHYIKIKGSIQEEDITSVYKDQRINPRRRYNKCIYIYTLVLYIYMYIYIYIYIYTRPT